MNSADMTIATAYSPQDRPSPSLPSDAGDGLWHPEHRQAVIRAMRAAWKSLRAFAAGRLKQPSQRRLRVSETLSLGEKRFVSIVEVDGTAYLIGGGAAGVSLLTQLAPAAGQRSFRETAQQAWQRAETT